MVWSPPDWEPEAVEEVDAVEVEPAAPEESQRATVEVEVRQISGTAALGNYAKRAYEIWTKNRVYGLDGGLECIEVIDLATGRSNPKHAFLGARLVGGQTRNGNQNELSFPLPTPGGEAVFQKLDTNNRIKLSVTSRVTRVILHVHRVKVESAQRDGAWGKITRH